MSRIQNEKQTFEGKYYSELCSETDLKEAVAFGKSLVGESHIDIDTLVRRHRVNSQILTCIRTSSQKELRGYFILYPLTQEAYLDICALKLVNGRDIKDHHIASARTEASALYIGMAGATGVYVKGLVLKEMIQQVNDVMSFKNLKAVCTRGATKDGKRVCQTFGFKPLDYPSEIAMLSVSKQENEGRIFDRQF